jgi:hypothetical protein
MNVISHIHMLLVTYNKGLRVVFCEASHPSIHPIIHPWMAPYKEENPGRNE